jgi:uncharacterized phage protein (TIGR02218 family)
MPRSIPTGLKAHYALGTTRIKEFWRATLKDGTVIASTTHTDDVVITGMTVNGYVLNATYVSSAGYNPSDIESGSDLSVDNMEVDGYLSSPLITQDDIHSGRWDYATIVLFEAVPDIISLGVNILRSGTLGQVKAGRTMFTAELRGLTQKYARRIVMLTTQECNADLGDARCKIDLDDWTVYGSVDSVTDNRTIFDATRVEAADFFTGGLLTWLSGANVGQSMEVKQSWPGILELHEGMPFPVTALNSDPGKSPTPAIPDTYKVYAGCQKRFYQDCIGKFNNGLNFRGFPHLPGVGVFGGPGTVMTPATVPGSQLNSPPPPPIPVPPAPGPVPAPGPSTPAPGAISGTVPAPIGSLNLTSYGGVGDGATDNITALNNAITDARTSGAPVFIPAGQFNYSGVIELNGVVLTGTGAASILYSTDYTQSSIFMRGDGPQVKNLRLTGAVSPSRLAAWPATRITVMGATNWVIHNNVIQHAGAASIQTAKSSGDSGTPASNGTITNNTIQDSWADSVHMTADAHHITVESNLIERSGDDGVACVSYTYDAGRVNNITARNNTITDNTSGRGMSVVGGSSILYQNNTIANMIRAGLYIVQEGGSAATKSCLNVTAEFNTITNCGGTVTGHAAVMVYSDGDPNDSITVARSLITQSGAQNGIRFFGPQTNILFDRNQIVGAATDYDGDTSDPDITIVPYVAAPPPPAPAPPPPATGGWGSDSIVLISGANEEWLQVGNTGNVTWVADNPWGAAGLTRGTYAGLSGTTFESAFGRGAAPYGSNGEVSARFAGKWPNTTSAQHEVKAYPSLLTGRKPGYYSPTNLVDGKPIILPDGSTSMTAPSGATPGTFLPLQANGNLPPVNCSFDWHHNVTPSGQGHISFDIWLTAQANQLSGWPGGLTHEIMIPVDYWGNYGAANTSPNGRNPADYSHDVVIDGITWAVYYHTHFGWNFIAFEPRNGPLANGTPHTFNLSAYLNHVRSRGWSNGTEWFSSTELGVEPVEGVFDLSITDYRVWRP